MLTWPWVGNPDRVFADFAALNNPYHNADHTVGMVTRLRAIASHLIVPLSADEAEDLDIAGLYHDAGHAGITIRQNSPRDLPRLCLSNERYAVLMMRTELDDVLPPWRVERIENLIMATTFGQVPHPHPPTTPMEKIIVYADVGNINSPFENWVKDNFNVLRETPRAEWTTDFESFRQTRLGFLGYVRAKLDEVVPLVKFSYGKFLNDCLTDTVRRVSGADFTSYEPVFNDIVRSTAL